MSSTPAEAGAAPKKATRDFRAVRSSAGPMGVAAPKPPASVASNTTAATTTTSSSSSSSSSTAASGASIKTKKKTKKQPQKVMGRLEDAHTVLPAGGDQRGMIGTKP
jgi:hypothetical protein